MKRKYFLIIVFLFLAKIIFPCSGVWQQQSVWCVYACMESLKGNTQCYWAQVYHENYLCTSCNWDCCSPGGGFCYSPVYLPDLPDFAGNGTVFFYCDFNQTVNIVQQYGPCYGVTCGLNPYCHTVAICDVNSYGSSYLIMDPEEGTAEWGGDYYFYMVVPNS